MQMRALDHARVFVSVLSRVGFSSDAERLERAVSHSQSWPRSGTTERVQIDLSALSKRPLDPHNGNRTSARVSRVAYGERNLTEAGNDVTILALRERGHLFFLATKASLLTVGSGRMRKGKPSCQRSSTVFHRKVTLDGDVTILSLIHI